MCLRNRVWRAYFVNFTVDLKSVVVHDHYQVVQFAESGKHSCLPNLTFLDLAITKKCIYLSLIHI